MVSAVYFCVTSSAIVVALAQSSNDSTDRVGMLDHPVLFRAFSEAAWEADVEEDYDDESGDESSSDFNMARLEKHRFLGKLLTDTATWTHSEKGRPLRGTRCASDKPSKDDRVCERTNNPNNKQAAGCKCTSICHIWGDPHLAPMYSTCTGVVASKPGKYLFWHKPGSEVNSDVKVEIETEVISVKQRRKKHNRRRRSPSVNGVWVRKAYIDGVEVFNANDCPRKSAMTRKFDLYSDGAILNGLFTGKHDPDVTVTVTVKCRPSQNKKGIEQLEVIIKIDDMNTAQPTVDDWVLGFSGPQLGLAPVTTPYFSDDIGLCVDHVVFDAHSGEIQTSINEKDYVLNCARQSENKDSSGRKCSCGAECAAWGDPHLIDFGMIGCRSAKKAKCGFEVKDNMWMTRNERSFMYAVQDLYAIEVITDRCDLTTGVRVYFMNKVSQAKFRGCTSKSGDSNRFANGNWEVYEILAKDVCRSGVDTNKATRKTIEVPSSTGDPNLASKHYSEDVDGFDLGRNILVDGELVPIPDGKGYSTCLHRKGYNPLLANSLIDMGSVKTILKCHRTKSKRRFFNVCVERNGVVQESFLVNGKNVEDPISQVLQGATFDNGVMLGVELAAQSSGWCATGRPIEDIGSADSGIELSGKAFKYRAADETKKFKLALAGSETADPYFNT